MLVKRKEKSFFSDRDENCPLNMTGPEVCLGPRGWRRGVVISGVRCMNEVNPHRARLVLGWVTVFGRVYHLGM